MILLTLFLPYIYKYFEFRKSFSNIIFVCHDMWCTKNTLRVSKFIEIFWFGFSKHCFIIDDKKQFMGLCWRIGISPRFITRNGDSYVGFDNIEMIEKLMIYPVMQKLIRWIHFFPCFCGIHQISFIFIQSWKPILRTVRRVFNFNQQQN